MRTIFAVLIMLPSLYVDAEQQSPLDRLRTLMYQYEVCIYCGLSDADVSRGYHDKSKQLVEMYRLPRETYEKIRMQAWAKAYREWQNRGLGGFKNWCRTEGISSAKTLRSNRQHR